MLIKTLELGHMGTNCYVLIDEESLKCAVIDPGDESNTVLNYLEDNKLSCEAIMLTHGHFDHTGAVAAVKEATGAVFYMHRADCGTDHFQYPAPEDTHWYDDGDSVQIGGLTVEVIGTPGHTPGGVTLKCENALFTGDTLFRDSCGRTDFPGGDMQVQLTSLRKLAELEGDYEVYPGHMDSTTLERERRFNHYMRYALGEE